MRQTLSWEMYYIECNKVPRVPASVRIDWGYFLAQVTMMGQSAGSSSVLYHLMSPRSEGLFNQVPAQPEWSN